MNAVSLLMLKGAAVRSRVVRSQAAWRAGAAAQCTCLPQGPEPEVQLLQTKPSAVSGVLGLCLAQSASRTSEQSRSQWVGPTRASLALKPVPSAVIPQTPPPFQWKP